MTVPVEPAAVDVQHLAAIRRNVELFLWSIAEHVVGEGAVVLDVAPQDHAGIRPFLPSSVRLETLDLDESSGATYIGDITQHNAAVPDQRFDCIVCTEVLEHTLQPFDAVAEMRRMLRPGGILAITVPFNFRVHGPLPDCWRFTEHGLRALLTDFDLVSLDQLETPGRPLMPIQLTAVARRPA